MKKFLSLLLSLCLLLCALPMQVLALPGSIFPSEGAVKTVTLDDGSLSLQNEYIYMTFRKLWGTYAYLTVAPAAKPPVWWVMLPIAGGIALAGGFMIFKKKRRR